jgi:hypothetical protein
MRQWFRQSVRWQVVLACIVLIWSWHGIAEASPLAERLAKFPDWQDKPPVQMATGDLSYPDWFLGNWRVTTTLVDLAAPLAPDVSTPGFASNRDYLNQPVEFEVRFVESGQGRGRQIVSDRAFNGLNLARAYLGDRAVQAVKVDPSNPNRQITLLRGDRQLVSTVTGRAVEAPTIDRFLTTEVFRQEFRGAPQLYLNEVETTTAYRQSEELPIVADQITAIYLSPQDPDYFKARNHPVALYRYRLEFLPR